jgi:hypothetical protein
MKLIRGVGVVALVCMVLAIPARAAKITIGDSGGFVDVGVIAQTWARVTQDGSADHSGPSYDIFFRRMRIYVNGALNDRIGIIANTDVSYTQAGAAASDVVVSPVTQQNSVRFNSPTIVLNEALGYYSFCKELIFMGGLQLIPWVRQTATDITKFSAVDEQGDITERGRPAGFFGRNRDLGLAFRGLLVNNIISYKLGVFNGVQSIAGKSTATASGLVTGATNAAVNFPAYTGVNPGDAPSYDGYVRINFIGYEPDYSLLGIAYDGKSYFAIGTGANIQPRAIAASARGLSTATYQGYFADLHLDLAFSDKLFEFVVEAGWVRTIYSGNGAPVSSANATGLALINNAGTGFYGSIGLRIAWIYPYFAFEDYISNLNGQNVQSTFLAFGTGGLPASGRVGSLQTYHGGLKFFVSPPPGNQFLIDLDIAFQNKENAGLPTTANDGAAINGNQWSGILEFQFKI